MIDDLQNTASTELAMLNSDLDTRSAGDQRTIVRAATIIMGAVVALTFLFGFGNVLSLGLRLGVEPWVAPLVAPAVDLSILGLLLVIRYLALHGAPPEQLLPARRLLLFSSVVTLALNVAEPLIAGHIGRAAFDTVGPLLLIGWAEVGPNLMRVLASASRKDDVLLSASYDHTRCDVQHHPEPCAATTFPVSQRRPSEDLLPRARSEDLHHRKECHRPISADTLRRKLGIGSARARQLVKYIRSESDSAVPGAR